jgi:hypothetical protein
MLILFMRLTTQKRKQESAVMATGEAKKGE